MAKTIGRREKRTDVKLQKAPSGRVSRGKRKTEAEDKKEALPFQELHSEEESGAEQEKARR